MTAEYAQAMDRWVEEIRAACGIPPALVRRVDTCRNCGQAIQGGANTSTGWTHVGDWQGVRCQGALTGAAPQVEAGRRSPGETLAAVDAAVEGRCGGPGCGVVLTEHSPSGWWCSADCQAEWNQQQVARPSPGSAPVRGSEGVDPSHMRWRPDLVTAFDDTGLTLLDRHHRDDTGLDYCIYTNPDTDRAFLRVDDGHRFVGLDMPWSELQASGPSEPFRRLERELGDRRRLGPEPPEPLPVTPLLAGQTPEEFATAVGGWHRWLARSMGETSEAFRRVGEAVTAAVGAYNAFPAATRQAIEQAMEADRDRQALRAVCGSEAMYERALAAAQDRGWSARRMMAAVTAGQYTEAGWTAGGIDGR